MIVEHVRFKMFPKVQKIVDPYYGQSLNAKKYIYIPQSIPQIVAFMLGGVGGAISV